MLSAEHAIFQFQRSKSIFQNETELGFTWAVIQPTVTKGGISLHIAEEAAAAAGQTV